MGRGGCRQGSGRKSSWTNLETQTIRVPKIFVAQILDYARLLDSGLEDLDPGAKLTHFDSETVSESILLQESGAGQISIFEVIDSVSESKTPSKKPDGLKWLSSEQAWEVAKARGCERNLEGFRKWCPRKPQKCLELYGLRKLPVLVKGNSSAPAFEDVQYLQEADCLDF
jgi:hypothetical protein